jgi:predicted nicotinamide N-methyase
MTAPLAPAEAARLRAFIEGACALTAPPLAPELRAWLADEIAPIWAMTEAALAAERLAPPFWAFAWAGGQALARWLLDNPAAVRGRRVLAFGCGGGIEALAAARAGARAVIANDTDPAALVAAGLNAGANGLRLDLLGADLLADPAAALALGPEVVLAGDAAYERPMALRLAGWLRARADEGALVLVGDAGRGFLPLDGMTRLATYEVPTPRDLEDRDSRRASVWRVGGL